jgi:iron(II)-dependent oxidoreductase
MKPREEKIGSSARIEMLAEARQRTLELMRDLNEEQLMGPRLAIVNPMRWEIGHVAFFQEFWMLRHLLGRAPIMPNGDSLYDSARVAHDTRWDLPLPSRSQTLEYMQRVLEEVARTQSEPTRTEAGTRFDRDYFLGLVLFHECMHAEALTYTRQTLSYRAPEIGIATGRVDTVDAEAGAQTSGDARVPGGTFRLGSDADEGFIFDNEEWAHDVEIAPFSISRTAVSNREFAAFVEDEGYRRRNLWSDTGWSWRESQKAEHPVYWRREESGWSRRDFDTWRALELDHPVLHVSWFEAEAFCRWAGRRLPSEAEWEAAAACQPGPDGKSLGAGKNRYPWGDEVPTPDRANLDWKNLGCVAVYALPAGDSAWGCRQMIGNVWEWTSSDFGPYPGFKPGPYKEYSEPWFGDHKVLRGGCWVTRSEMIRNNYRNYYTPDRRDVWAGFRTCAL